MSIQEIDLKVKALRELQTIVEEATAQMEAIKDAIKLKMVDEGTEVLQGKRLESHMAHGHFFPAGQ